MMFCCIDKCTYPNFGIDKNTRLPYCRNHQTRRTDLNRRSIIQKAIEKEKKVQSKVRGLINTDANQEIAERNFIKKDYSHIDELDKWFNMVATFIAAKPYCWNCGAHISKSDYRNASAHIFPKSIFPSVATHPFNFIVAGNRCGCHNLTHRLDTFSKMDVFEVAVRRFRIFEPLITEKHKYLNSFIEYADKYIQIQSVDQDGAIINSDIKSF